MRPEDLVQTLEAAEQAGSLDRLTGLLAPDVRGVWNGKAAYEGLEAFRRWHAETYGRARGYTTRRTLRAAAGDLIACEWTDAWTEADSGRAVEGYGAEFLRLRDGRIAERRSYWHGYWFSAAPAAAEPSRERPPLDLVDRMSADSFPASDPPAGPARIGPETDTGSAP